MRIKDFNFINQDTMFPIQHKEVEYMDGYFTNQNTFYFDIVYKDGRRRSFETNVQVTVEWEYPRPEEDEPY